MFMMAGYNDSDADSATTHLLTGGFKGSEHPEECLRFWYTIGVSRTCDIEKRDGWSNSINRNVFLSIISS